MELLQVSTLLLIIYSCDFAGRGRGRGRGRVRGRNSRSDGPVQQQPLEPQEVKY